MLLHPHCALLYCIIINFYYKINHLEIEKKLMYDKIKMKHKIRTLFVLFTITKLKNTYKTCQVLKSKIQIIIIRRMITIFCELFSVINY